jgi:hypothetical protein
VVVSGLLSGVGSGCAARHFASDFVRLTTNPLAVHQCQFVGNVVAGSGWSGALYTVGMARVEQQFREQAAAMDADTVYMGQTAVSPYVVRGTGEAYRCGGRVQRS